MEVYKAKSLTPELTDEDIEQGFFQTRFISFESAIHLFRQHYGLMDLGNAPKGCRVTNQGIEIISNI